MRIDYQSVSKPKSYAFDFCVIGGGVAGIIVARELVKKFPGNSVGLIESGDMTLDNLHNRALKDVSFSDLSIKRNSREFALGGATNTWGGLCTHFEDFEIQGRNYLEAHDWPVSYEALNKYYQYASQNYDVA
ncbi:lycopene cyclase family protein [Hahella ganghwensis]|uniref:lycopene cyclase family protein n=1 Tax=Hahella ganghwensis TaxID=286420 RepID=UPI0003624B53|nr:lycopene cyclase family protein [Hahella ganghwensis]